MLFNYGIYKTLPKDIPFIKGADIIQFDVVGKTGIADGKELGGYVNTHALLSRRVTKFNDSRTIICAVGNSDYYSVNVNFLKSDNLNYLHFLCGIMNSFVIDYFVRKIIYLSVNLHHINSIPIIPYNQQVTELAIKISKDTTNQSLRNELDVLVAKLYNISYGELKYILSTFNLISNEIKEDILNRYEQET